MSQSSLQKTLTASTCNFLTAGVIVAGGSALTLWEPYLGFSTSDIGVLNALSANGIGAGVGAFLGGFLADRYGRRNVFTWDMLLYMVGIFLLMTATSYAQFLTGTIVAGLAAGISVPASWTYICECSGVTHRARNIALSQMGWGLGPAAVLGLSYLFAPSGPCFDYVVDVADWFGVRANRTFEVNVFASRIVFAVLFVVAFLSWMFQRQLEASKEWIDHQDSIERDKPLFDNMKEIFTPKFKKVGLTLTLMYLTWNVVAGAMGFFQGHLYETVGNLSNVMANRTLADQWFFTAILTGVGAFFIDKFQHRHLLVSFVAIGCLAWLIVAFFGISTYAGMMVVTVLWAIQAGVSVQLFFSLWSVELYPFKVRAAAVGVMFAIVRIISGVLGWNLAVGFDKLGDDMITPASFVMFAFFALSAYLGWKIAPETRGKSMTQISEERYGK